ncbi:MAG: hypothetical protein JWN44_4566, partial [Myxococcales bacterium]|nr:hypothetical protein [Myxococcales bacterium]
MLSWCSPRLLVLGFLLVTACERGQSPAAPSPPPPPTAPKPEPSQEAPKPEPSRAALRSLADAFIRDVIAGERHAAYLKMDHRARASSTEAQFGSVLDGLSRTFGRLLEAHYDSTEIGTNISFAGIRKMWTFVYDVRTETKPNGGYQAEVTLSADPEPAVSGFVISVTVLHGKSTTPRLAAAADLSGSARADAASSPANAHDGSSDLDWAALTKAKAGAWADYTMTLKKPLRNPDGSPV